MTERQVNKILENYRKSLENLLPNNEKQIGLLWLCLKEIFEELMFADNTKLPGRALSKRNKKEDNFDNILAICDTSIKLCNEKNLDSLSTGLGHMDAKLFQIHLDVQNARRKITTIMNKIVDKLPDE